MHSTPALPRRLAGPRRSRGARFAWLMATNEPGGPQDPRDTPPVDDERDDHNYRGRGRRGRRAGPPGAGGFGPDGFGPGFGPGGPHRRGGGRRGGRGGRGDVRAAVLLLLDESPMHGYQLIQQITERSGGVWTPSPGSVYPALSQLEDEGLIRLEPVEGRKTASLTEAGAEHVRTHRADLGSPWDDVSGGVSRQSRDLRLVLDALMGAAHQVSHVGTPAQVAEAAQLLTQARKSLYRILAEDAPTD